MNVDKAVVAAAAAADKEAQHHPARGIPRVPTSSLFKQDP